MPKSSNVVARDRLRDAAQRMALERSSPDDMTVTPVAAPPPPAWTPPPAADPPVASSAEPPPALAPRVDPEPFTVGSDSWHDAVESLCEATP